MEPLYLLTLWTYMQPSPFGHIGAKRGLLCIFPCATAGFRLLQFATQINPEYYLDDSEEESTATNKFANISTVFTVLMACLFPLLLSAGMFGATPVHPFPIEVLNQGERQGEATSIFVCAYFIAVFVTYVLKVFGCGLWYTLTTTAGIFFTCTSSKIYTASPGLGNAH